MCLRQPRNDNLFSTSLVHTRGSGPRTRRGTSCSVTPRKSSGAPVLVNEPAVETTSAGVGVDCPSNLHAARQASQTKVRGRHQSPPMPQRRKEIVPVMSAQPRSNVQTGDHRPDTKAAGPGAQPRPRCNCLNCHCSSSSCCMALYSSPTGALLLISPRTAGPTWSPQIRHFDCTSEQVGQ